VRSKDRAEYFVDHSITRSIKSASIDRIDRSLDHSIDRSIDRIDQSLDQSLNRSITQSINQSIDQVGIDRSLDSIRFGFDSVVTARGKSRDDSLDRGTARARERTTIARRGTTMVGAWTW